MAMHLLIPHASGLSEACVEVLKLNPQPALPHLAELLGRLQIGERVGEDEFSPDTPHEMALARLRGEPGLAPSAAWAAPTQDGQAWALITPLHFAISTDGVRALAPEPWPEAEARAFFDLLAQLFPAAEGWRYHFAGPRQWLIGHESLASLQAASIERVLNRNVDVWMPEARTLRLLQNEMQMLLHEHPLNQAREARGAYAMNSAWISGCGVASGQPLPADLQIDASLSAPLLAGDWLTWAAAWRALDAGRIKTLLEAAKRGEQVTLTLCGERFAQSWTRAPQSSFKQLWQRLAPPRAAVLPVLEAL